ncbi:MarR family winged helix-turn-helix transcriptional regulator [Streptomyces sp. NBC_00859]|uniref:MarR family winged helix-turn-helix transcriptional regulator n=1 Tax=Streptomyces sp. NBC_00859 TaxID=2903682 RepID=UPI0038664E46|nr:MarR family transcriptional regulator [Streptomyces sp. NBC_00859]
MTDDAGATRAAAPSAPAHPGAPAADPRRVPDGSGTGSAPEAGDLGIVDSLVQLSFLVQGVLASVAAERGLSVIQLRLLGVLRDRKPGMQELARHLGLDKSSMTGLVDRAERRDLVRRAAAPHDGRAVQVSLTEQGHELARATTADAGRRILALTSDLDDAQRVRLSLLASALVSGRTTI